MESLPVRIEAPDLAVTADALIKRYGARTALERLDLTVPRGSVFALVGPNGSGKTTTFRILLDAIRSDGGEARVLGLDPRAAGPQVRAALGYVPEQYDFGYRWMRVGRLLRHHAAYHPDWDEAYADRLVGGLGVQLKPRFGRLSKGEARRVQLVMALAHRPPLLVLDEPLDGLDPLAREQVLGLLADHIAATPTTVLVATHLIHLVERLTDCLGVLRHGRCVAQMRRADLERGLKSYRAGVGDGWTAPADVADRVVRKNVTGSDIDWAIWGDEQKVRGMLAASGATVREVRPVSLEDAVIALLSGPGS
jgi:ABC-2 type transport system ATP-binding protein